MAFDVLCYILMFVVKNLFHGVKWYYYGWDLHA